MMPNTGQSTSLGDGTRKWEPPLWLAAYYYPPFQLEGETLNPYVKLLGWLERSGQRAEILSLFPSLTLFSKQVAELINLLH